MSAYRYDIKFRPTDEHANADGLCRLPLSGGTLGETGDDPAVFNLSQMEALHVTVNKFRGATMVARCTAMSSLVGLLKCPITYTLSTTDGMS